MARYFTEQAAQNDSGAALILTLRAKELKDRAAAEQCGRELLQLDVTCGVVVDLQEVGTLRTAVIAGIVGLNKVARRKGLQLCLVNVGPDTKYVLRALSLDKLFRIADSQEEAIRTVSDSAHS